MPVLDATFLIDQERQPRRMAPVAEAVRAYAATRHEQIVVPLPVAIEYASGARDPAERLRLLEAAYEVAYFDREVTLTAARLAAKALAAGTFPGWHDVGVAAFGRHRGMLVVTRDAEDFEALGCRVWDYSRSREPP